MAWKLQAITDELNGQEVTIDRDMLVGRHQDADLVLQSAEISRRHAAFLLKDDALWVQDLKSSNGTFVNDLRIEQEKLLKDGDIVQFASLKFNVLAPVSQNNNVVSPDVTPIAHEEKVAEPIIQQPAEAVAAAEFVKPVTPVVEAEPVVIEKEKTAAEQMSEQGMSALSERDQSVQVSRDGMPTGMSVPKPAPIPEGVDVQAKVEPTPVAIPEQPSVVDQQLEEKKNTSVGLITIIVLIILAVLAWLFFK